MRAFPEPDEYHRAIQHFGGPQQQVPGAVAHRDPQIVARHCAREPNHPNHPSFLRDSQASAQPSGVKVSTVSARTPSEIGAAFGVTKRDRAGALIVLGGGRVFFSEARRIAELAVQQRLPTMFPTREPVESGGLMSYGPNLAEQFYRAATYVDKILKGAKPADLPVEQPTTIELVINSKTAKAIGLAIPQDLLLRADKVIE